MKPLFELLDESGVGDDDTQFAIVIKRVLGEVHRTNEQSAVVDEDGFRMEIMFFGFVHLGGFWAEIVDDVLVA